jgi:hypothetical protein
MKEKKAIKDVRMIFYIPGMYIILLEIMVVGKIGE